MAKPKIKKKDPRTVCMKDRNGATMDVIVTDWIQFHKDVLMKDIECPIFVGLVSDIITMSVYVLMCDYHRDKMGATERTTYGIKIADLKKEEEKKDES